MSWILIVLLLVPAGLPAQKRPAHKAAPAKKQASVPAPTKWPISSIAIEGNHTYPKAVIIATSGLKLGQLAGKDDFEAARDRLMATGVFENVNYRFEPAPGGKGYAASFQVIEVEPTYPVRFDRLEATPAELTAVLERTDPFFGPRIPPTERILNRYAQALEEYLTRKGHAGKVIGKVAPEPSGDLAVFFRPEAAPPAVAEVRFQGNQVLTSTVLQNTFSGVAYGAPYTEENFRQLLNNSVRPLYDARGRINVSFPKITTEKAPGSRGVIVTVVINEGDSYKLGDVHITGVPPSQARDMLDTGKFKTGELANFDDVNASVERIKRFYRKSGYLRADAELSRQIHEKPKTVDVTVHIEDGPQYLFKTLTVEGLDLSGEAAIRKLWAIKEGKPFNADYPQYFLERVREDGLFDDLGKTRAATKIDEEAHTVDVTLYFSGAPPKPDERKRRSF